jgi:hypothetical protein
MFDAVTDCVIEALNAFCAKKMGEQLRNILSYPHICFIMEIRKDQLIPKKLQLI